MLNRNEDKQRHQLDYMGGGVALTLAAASLKTGQNNNTIIARDLHTVFYVFTTQFKMVSQEREKLELFSTACLWSFCG